MQITSSVFAFFAVYIFVWIVGVIVILCYLIKSFRTYLLNTILLVVLGNIIAYVLQRGLTI